MASGAGVILQLALWGGPVGALVLKALNHLGAISLNLGFSWELLVMLVVVAPIVEELAFREFVQTRLKSIFSKFRKRVVGPIFLANGVTSVLFALCHLVSHSIAVSVLIVVPSLILGALREEFDSVWPCMAVHAWFNACCLAVFLLL